MNMDSDFPAGTGAHEMMHALGVHHEHARWDRDDWVRIDFETLAKFNTRQSKKIHYCLMYQDVKKV